MRNNQAAFTPGGVRRRVDGYDGTDGDGGGRSHTQGAAAAPPHGGGGSAGEHVTPSGDSRTQHAAAWWLMYVLAAPGAIVLLGLCGKPLLGTVVVAFLAGYAFDLAGAPEGYSATASLRVLCYCVSHWWRLCGAQVPRGVLHWLHGGRCGDTDWTVASAAVRAMMLVCTTGGVLSRLDVALCLPPGNLYGMYC